MTNQYLVVFAEAPAEMVDVNGFFDAYLFNSDLQGSYLVSRDGAVHPVEVLDHDNGEYEVCVGNKIVHYADYREVVA